MKFPHRCVRCGACCLMETCPAGQMFWHIPKDRGCPSLYFSGDEALCGLVEFGKVPVGDGCCLKARVYAHGVEYDFASLPKDMKILASRGLREGRIPCLATK